MASKVLWRAADSSIKQIMLNGTLSLDDTKFDLRDDTAGNRTTITMLALQNVASAAACNSQQVDLGATRAPMYWMIACIEFQAAPTIGSRCDFYWAPSVSATGGRGVPGSGQDATFTTDASGGNFAPVAADSVGEAVARMQYVGSLPLANLAANTPQIGYIGTWQPPGRYGHVIMVNNSGQTTVADGNNHQIAINPIIPEAQ